MPSWLLLLLWLLGGGGPVEQPASNQAVAAVEIDLRAPADRSDLLAMMRRNAAAHGAHVDDVSAEAVPPPEITELAGRSIYAGVWRGDNDEDMEVLIDDAGHGGRPWIVFLRGSQVEAATRLRESLLRDIHRRWPDVRALPVLPSGGLPLAGDLVLTPSGYRILPSRAASYELATDSPLLAPR